MTILSNAHYLSYLIIQNNTPTTPNGRVHLQRGEGPYSVEIKYSNVFISNSKQLHSELLQFKPEYDGN